MLNEKLKVDQVQVVNAEIVESEKMPVTTASVFNVEIVDDGGFSTGKVKKIMRRYGAPGFYSDHGSLRALNEQFFSELYIDCKNPIFDVAEKRFFQYNKDNGLWESISDACFGEEISQFAISFAHWSGDTGYIPLMGYCFAKKVAAVIRGKTEREGAFENPPAGYRVHCQNCVLEYDAAEENWISRGFSPDDLCRNRSEITYVPEAKPERFLKELVEPAMNQDDVELLQMYAGQCLLGVNISQRFLLISGPGGGGKSTLSNVIEKLISRSNCTELRLDKMNGNFEVAALVGKTLLTGKDVKSNFLDTPAAFMLKALTGGDTLTAEYKHENDRVDVKCEFNVIIATNTRLHVKMESDISAWKRRLAWIKFDNQPPKNPIDNFADLLIRTEGSGILNWALEGAVKLLKQGGKIKLKQCQEERVDMLLEESDPVRLFVRDCMSLDNDADISGKEAWSEFNRYCDRHEFDKLTKTKFDRELPEVMEQELKLSKRNDIMRNGHSVRGYKGVDIEVK